MGDELAQLKAQVIAVFGKGIYAAAERRVPAVVMAKERSADEQAPLAAFHEALKVELRRLLQPH